MVSGNEITVNGL